MAKVKRGRKSHKELHGYKLGKPTKYSPKELLGVRSHGKWDELFTLLMSTPKGQKRDITFETAALAKIAASGLSANMRRYNKGKRPGTPGLLQIQEGRNNDHSFPHSMSKIPEIGELATVKKQLTVPVIGMPKKKVTLKPTDRLERVYPKFAAHVHNRGMQFKLADLAWAKVHGNPVFQLFNHQIRIAQ